MLTKKDESYVSAHFIVSEFKIVQLADPDFDYTFHAGKSEYWSPKTRKVEPDCNKRFIGVEWLGDGNKYPFKLGQYELGSKLTARLMVRYPSISPLCITGHENIAIPDGRKVDPGKYFDWRLFFELTFAELAILRYPHAG